jgi:adenylyltransferase/sulfurtransferase
MMPPLTAPELARYQRQMILPQLGPTGQAKLKAGRVLVVGAGGLGCPVLLYLGAAGVGTLGVVDGDRVELSNLPRQVLYTAADLGRPKAEVAAERVRAANPHGQVRVHGEFLTRHNALAILADYDLVIDCSDNFPVRYLVNDACVLLGKPLIYGALHQFEGQVGVFNARPESPTYRCLFPEPPAPGEVPNCAEAGIIGLVAGVVGLYQANEAIKWLAGLPGLLDGQLLVTDLLTYTTRTLRIRRRTDKSSITQLIDYEVFCGQKPPNSMKKLTAPELAQALQQAGDEWFVLDVREPWEYDICHLAPARLIPMGQVPDHLAQVPLDKKVAVYCHHGVRSAAIVQFLAQQTGHPELYNLTGGIHAWAREVEPGMAVY